MNLLTSSPDSSLAPLQAQTTKMLAYANWVHIAVIAGLGLYVGSSNLLNALLLSTFLNIAATAMVFSSPNSSASRCTVATAFMMQAATLVYLCSGHPWQIDMHMYFFAALAISVATFDAKAVIAAAAVTAIHHLILNIVAPAWVFPGGSDFARVVLHAVIVIAQTAALLTLIVKLHEAVATAAKKSEEALKAQESLREEDIERQKMVNQLGLALSGLAEGNLTTRLDARFTAQYEKLRSDFNLSLEELERLISDVIGQIGGIRGSINEINASADSLARRTENQAASLEETAAALDEITATVETTAEGSKTANELVTVTHARAEKSGEVVRDAVTAMSEIERSSDKISDIVSVIDDIAFQTNLLALNAGVEAARAGDAGKGFAVVADEVRKLAQSSSDAAKEIKEIITSSRTHVGRGVELVGMAGGELEDIVEKVTKFAGLISEITVATSEQATALSEVNSSINRMNQMTQENAAMAEESTAASQILNAAVGHLSQIVQRFKTNDAPAADGFGEPAYRRSA